MKLLSIHGSLQVHELWGLGQKSLIITIGIKIQIIDKLTRKQHKNKKTQEFRWKTLKPKKQLQPIRNKFLMWKIVTQNNSFIDPNHRSTISKFLYYSHLFNLIFKLENTKENLTRVCTLKFILF